MSKLENITIKLKNAKLKNIEKICSCFSQDYTAIQTAQKLGISRQTVNHYYKILRGKLNEEIFSTDNLTEEILKSQQLNIKYMNIYNRDILFIEYQDDILILEDSTDFPYELKNYIQTSLKDSLSKHKKANTVRVLFNLQNHSYVICGYFKSDNYFEEFLEKRLKRFRGISKEKLFSHLKESQLRYSFSQETIYEKIIHSFKKIS